MHISSFVTIVLCLSIIKQYGAAHDKGNIGISSRAIKLTFLSFKWHTLKIKDESKVVRLGLKDMELPLNAREKVLRQEQNDIGDEQEKRSKAHVNWIKAREKSKYVCRYKKGKMECTKKKA